MTWTAIWQLISQFQNALKDPADWRVSLDGKQIGPVITLDIDSTHFQLSFLSEDETTVLEARKGSNGQPEVFVNGLIQLRARLVAAINSRPPLRTAIVVLIFKRLEIGGSESEVRLENPK